MTIKSLSREASRSARRRLSSTPFKLERKEQSFLSSWGELKQHSQWHWSLSAPASARQSWRIDIWPHKAKWQVTTAEGERGDLSAGNLLDLGETAQRLFTENFL